MIKRIVITGGPGTGKTVLVEALERMGYACFHEVIREMTFEAKKQDNNGEIKTNPLAFVPDPLAFNRQILEGRVRQFREAQNLEEPLVFYDRGIPDVIAYMDYFDQAYDCEFTDPCRNLRYDMAVVLPPWKAIYRQDGERLESYEEACEIHQCLLDSYRQCGYRVQSLPPGTVAERIESLLQLISGADG